MNRINSYDISKLSFHDIKELEENYISQVKNKNIKKSLNLFMSSNKLHTHMLLKIIKDKIFTEMKIPILKK